MERQHRRKLQEKFGPLLRGKQVVCLEIPDKFRFMQPELVSLLQRKLGLLLR